METIFIDGLAPSVRKGGLFRVLIEEVGIPKDEIGAIVLVDRWASVGVADGVATKAVNKLNGLQIDGESVVAWADLVNPEGHVGQLLRWLDLESKAEVGQKRIRKEKGRLSRLVVRGGEVGLGGRMVLRVAPKNEAVSMPYSSLGVGAPVVLVQEAQERAGADAVRGVISRQTRGFWEITVNYVPDDVGGTWKIEGASDEVVRQRLERALGRVAGASEDRLAELRDVVLGGETAEFLSANVNLVGAERLNSAQKQAVLKMMLARDVGVIHGPPGTGKTTAVVSLIRSAVAEGERVLACAPSNMGVDNVVVKLMEAGVDVVRIGHPVRAMEAVQSVTLSALVEGHADYARAKKMRKEAAGLRREAGKFKRARPEKGAKSALRDEAREVMDEARALEALAVERVLDEAQVVLGTLTAVDSTFLGSRGFDLGVIDEAGQSTEPASWMPIVRCNRIVLAGDHEQLPPTVLSQKAADEGFAISLLERLMNKSPEISVQLTEQYRMHEVIMGFSSAEFYQNTLEAHTSVKSHLLTDLTNIQTNQLTSTPFTFIDTAGAGYEESVDAETLSKFNEEEAGLVTKKVEELVGNGVSAESIAIITPYSAQANLLREAIDPKIEVGSVDGFQGREKEAIIISLVRSNYEGEIGFLSETRRLNVAMTRARRKLIMIGDSATLCSSQTTGDFFSRLIGYAEKCGAYRSVWEE